MNRLITLLLILLTVSATKAADDRLPFDVRGPICEVTTHIGNENSIGLDEEYPYLRFGEKGNLIGIDFISAREWVKAAHPAPNGKVGKMIHHDPEGNYDVVMEWEYQTLPNGEERVSNRSFKGCFWETYIQYTYNADGNAVTAQKLFTKPMTAMGMIDSQKEFTIMYTDIVTDEYGNWTSRTATVKDWRDLPSETRELLGKRTWEDRRDLTYFRHDPTPPTLGSDTDAAIREFVNRNVRYPAIAQENGEQGEVKVELTIATDGSVINTRVVKSVSPSLDREAERVLKKLPPFNPATVDGTPVPGKYTASVKFRLQ